MKLKVKEIKEMFEALQKLDEFDFDGKTKYAIARNIKKLRNSVEALDDVKNKIVLELAPETKQISQEKNPSEYGTYLEKYNQALAVEEDIGNVFEIALEDLKLDQRDKDTGKLINPIAPTIVAALLPMIKE